MSVVVIVSHFVRWLNVVLVAEFVQERPID